MAAASASQNPESVFGTGPCLRQPSGPGTPEFVATFNHAGSFNFAGVMESNEMFCRDCGQVILRRAEICPKCGCRQSPPEEAKLPIHCFID
jgi:hypothetical protein